MNEIDAQDVIGLGSALVWGFIAASTAMFYTLAWSQDKPRNKRFRPSGLLAIGSVAITLFTFPLLFPFIVDEYRSGLRFALLVVLWYALMLYFLPKLQAHLHAKRRRKEELARSTQSVDTSR